MGLVEYIKKCQVYRCVTNLCEQPLIICERTGRAEMLRTYDFLNASDFIRN